MTNTNDAKEGNSDVYYNKDTVVMDPNYAPEEEDNMLLDDDTVELEEPADNETVELDEPAQDVTDNEEQTLEDLEAVATAMIKSIMDHYFIPHIHAVKKFAKAV
eukprot:15348863-Ditylum_brightwellii.AAC.1